MRLFLALVVMCGSTWADPAPTPVTKPAFGGTFELAGGLGLGGFPGAGDGEASITLPALGAGARVGAMFFGRLELEGNAGLLVSVVRIGYAGLGARLWLVDRMWVGGGIAMGADLAGRERNVGPGYAARLGFVLKQRARSRINLVIDGLFFRLGKDKDDIQTPELINTNSFVVQVGYQWF